MTPKITVQQAYQNASQSLQSISDNPALEAQVLLANVMGRSRAWILAHGDEILDSADEDHFSQAIGRYLGGESLPYVLGWWEFYGRRFSVNKNVLIPRPETEHLVESALSYLRSNPTARKALDVGTGSGCIAISLALEVHDLRIVATDISWDALKVATVNAEDHQVRSRIELVQMDLNKGLIGTFDLICANLPYIPSDVLNGLEVSKREPIVALDGGMDGYELIRPLLMSLPDLLLPGGCALFELEAGTGDVILQMARTQIGYAKLRVLQDLSGHDRVLIVQT